VILVQKSGYFTKLFKKPLPEDKKVSFPPTIDIQG
jgi:hypothetical protein